MENVLHDTELVERIRSLANQTFPELAEIKSVELNPLNKRKDTPVWRISFTDANDCKLSIIAKLQSVPEAAMDFKPELANYIFLQTQRERFNRFPKLLENEKDIFLLEDLGPDTFLFRNRDEILKALADTFAQLHLSFAGMEKEYAKVRAAFDLPATQDEPRRNSEGGRKLAARHGANALSDYAAVLGICEKEIMLSHLYECIDFISDPKSLLRTFVHDDVADRRQTIVKDGIIHLLDFEHGKYHHALMDLAKLLIGKVEHNFLLDGMFYNHPNVPIELAGYYRARRTELGAADFSNEDWNHHLASAMIVQLLLITGRMLEMSVHKFLDPLAMIIRDIIRRLQLQLQNNNSHSELMELLGKMEERILV